MAAFRFREPGFNGRVGYACENVEAAKRQACVAAHRKPIDFSDRRLVEQLWHGLERSGWRIEEVRP